VEKLEKTIPPEKKIKVKAAGQRNPTIRTTTALPQQSKKMLDLRKKEMQKVETEIPAGTDQKATTPNTIVAVGENQEGVLKSQI
tara:strand:- start:713 stop:964 length:252 start_codon:yes stop_codon:yes gene_type:complete